MQILNFSDMPAACALIPDRSGREHVVVVVKATFSISPGGGLQLAREQVGLKFADEHFGEPGASEVRYEHDFVRFKPLCDVIVHGSAYAPARTRVRSIDVGLEIGNISKEARVFGDRVWLGGVAGSHYPSEPVPFERMPVVWSRAFGGVDDARSDPHKHVYEVRNLVGVGLRVVAHPGAPHGAPLPNIEDPRHLVGSPRDRPEPKGFGFVGRGWQPRIGLAGTYDERWKDERFPFLPDDFDERYHQGAPADQLCPHLRGGERVRLKNFTPQGSLELSLPEVTVPVVVQFPKSEEALVPRVDTVILEPDERRVILCLRASTPCRSKPTDIASIRVGQPPRGWERARAKGKRYVDWKRFLPPSKE